MEKHKRESEFDNETFFEEYAKMARSVDGLEARRRVASAAAAVPGARGQNRSGSRLRLRLALPLCR